MRLHFDVGSVPANMADGMFPESAGFVFTCSSEKEPEKMFEKGRPLSQMTWKVIGRSLCLSHAFQVDQLVVLLPVDAGRLFQHHGERLPQYSPKEFTFHSDTIWFVGRRVDHRKEQLGPTSGILDLTHQIKSSQKSAGLI